MLKMRFLAIVCAVLLLVTGCAAKDDFADYEFSEPPVVEGLSAKTEFSEYDGDIERINVILTNDRDERFTFSDTFSLQKKVNGEWRPISLYGPIKLISSEMPPRSEIHLPVVLKDHVTRPLLPGQYRVWVGDFEKVSAEFEVR